MSVAKYTPTPGPSPQGGGGSTLHNSPLPGLRFAPTDLSPAGRVANRETWE
jgi:hypothetical protein